MEVLGDIVAFVAVGLAVWWHLHKLRQHGLATTKLELESKKLRLEIQELEAKHSKMLRRDEGAALLADAIVDPPTGSTVQELIPINMVTRVLVPNRKLIAKEARNLRPGAPAFAENLARLKADDAFLMALGSNDHVAELGVVQLANIAVAFPERAGAYLRVLAQLKRDAPAGFRNLLGAETDRLEERDGRQTEVGGGRVCRTQRVEESGT